MLMIRLSRAGGKNRPFYRVVVIDSRKQRDGRSVEEIGYYNPLEDPVVVNVDRDKVAYWTERGAQLSDSVRTLLKRENSLHISRRGSLEFEAAAPEELRPKKTGRKPAKAEAAPVPSKPRLRPRSRRRRSPKWPMPPSLRRPPRAKRPSRP